MSKTAKGLVEYARAQVGQPYWYCSQGQKPTNAWLDQKIKQYPSKWTQPRINKARGEAGKFARCYDCVGLIKGYLWTTSPTDDKPKYNASQDKTADGMEAVSKAKPIETLPEIPGILVFCKGHVGVYVGNRRVIEAWGFQQVDDHSITFQKWKTWGFCPYIDYEGADKDYVVPVSKPKPVTTVQTTTTNNSGLKVGAKVKIKPDAKTYYTGGVKIPSVVMTKEYTIGQTTYQGKPMVKGGQVCVLLKEINSWVAVENIASIDKIDENVTVRFKQDATLYYNGGVKIPDWVKKKTFVVSQVDYKKGSGKKVIKGGQECVLLKEINSWAALDFLERI